jgi:hypothetical protein
VGTHEGCVYKNQIHSQVIGHTPTAIEGLLLHIGRPSPAGFEVIEVWESRAHYDRYQRELRASIADGPGAGMPLSMQAATIEEFVVRGLVDARPSGRLTLIRCASRRATLSCD